MKRSRKRVFGATLAVVLSAAAVALVAPTAFAGSGTVVGALPSSVPAGAKTSYTFALKTTSGQASSFNLSAPSSQWTIESVDQQAGVSLVSGVIQGRNVTASSSTTLTVKFTATAPCDPTASTAWGLVARSGGNFTGSTFAIDPSSSLSTALSGTCTAKFETNRGPKDAVVNQNISSSPYNAPPALPIEVIVKAADGSARPDIPISLGLSGGTPSANLQAPTVASDANGHADFSPVTIDKTGLNYMITPTGTGVSGTASDSFGVYQDESNCNGACTVHGNSSTIHSTVTDNRTGTLSVLVSGVPADVIDCTATIPDGYSYKPVSTEVTVWQVTGTGSGSQTIVVLVDKSLIRKILNRGSSHIDFCYQADNGKTFVDKFNHDASAGPGLLPDCDSTHTNNCIVSETGVNGGDRLITVTVDDGKGRP